MVSEGHLEHISCKEADAMTKTIIPLYERLSRDDELQGESSSISNPKKLISPKTQLKRD